MSSLFRQVVVTNSLGWTRTDVVNITAPDFPGGVTVTDASTQQTVPSQVAGGVLYFLATIAPVGYNTYIITPTPSDDETSTTENVNADTTTVSHLGGSIAFSNGVIVVSFDQATGNMQSVKNVASGVAMELTHVPMQYVNGTGGAYILVEDFEAQPLSPPLGYTVQSGPLFDELCQTFSEQVRACARVCVVKCVVSP